MSEDPQAAFGAPDRPSRAGYWAGGALIAVAVLGAIAWFVVGMVRFGDAVDDLQRVSIPGSADVTLTAGRKSIYYEGPGGSDAEVPPLHISVAALPGGAPVAVGGHSGSVSYSISGHAGRSIAGFRAPRDGRYRVSADATYGAPGVAQLAVGRGLGNRLVRAIVGAIVIFFAGGGLGAAVLARTSARRR
ncbi:MAG TPA: hypothetical protein VFZ89_00030 [Solirubrobacteraceae bacterium]